MYAMRGALDECIVSCPDGLFLPCKIVDLRLSIERMVDLFSAVASCICNLVYCSLQARLVNYASTTFRPLRPVAVQNPTNNGRLTI